MLCKVRVVALVYWDITGITSNLLAMRDVQRWVRHGCVPAFSRFRCVTIRIPLHQEDQSPIARLPMFCPLDRSALV